jgi:hypothetical protein
MANANWTAVAIRFCDELDVPKPPDDWGWMTAPEHPDVAAVFLPKANTEKLRDVLNAQGIKLLATSHHQARRGGSYVVAVVQCTDAAKLRTVLEETMKPWFQ